MFRLNGVSSSFLLQKAWRSTEAKAKVCDLTVVDRNVDLSCVKSQLTIHGEEFLNSAYHAWAVFLNSAHHPPPPPPPPQAQASHQGSCLGRHQPEREVWHLYFRRHHEKGTIHRHP